MTKTGNKTKLHFFWPNTVKKKDSKKYTPRPFFWNEFSKHFDIKLYCKAINQGQIDNDKCRPINKSIEVIDFFENTSFRHLLKNYRSYKEKIKGLPQDEKYFVMYPYKRSGVLLAWMLCKKDLTIWVKSNSGIKFIPHENTLMNWLKWLVFPFKKVIYLLISHYLFIDKLILYTSEITINTNNHINQHEVISCSPFNENSDLIQQTKTNSICYVGDESPQKGLVVLLRALHELPNKSRPKLEIIGMEKFKKETNKALADELDIVIHSVIYDRDLFYKKLSCNDALIMPSFAEKQGKVQLEAMSAGVVPICSDSGGTYMTIDNYYNGLLFQPGNASELSEKIQLLYNHPQLRENLQENGLAHVDNLSLEKQCNKMAAIIKNRFGYRSN